MIIKIISFAGKVLLTIFGLLMLASVVLGIFEQDMSILEISPLEMIYIVLFFSLGINHFKVSASLKIGWTSTLYRPMRNLGWLGILTFLTFGIIVSEKSGTTYLYRNEHILQLIVLNSVLLCIHLATPKNRILTKTRPEDSNKQGQTS